MIYMCMPTYGLTHPAAWEAFRDAESAGPAIHSKNTLYSSLLGECFNIFWCNALNLQRDGARITHWFMQHNDVAPEPGYLNIMLRDMEETGADVLAAVVPLKDDRMLTSTAVDGNDRWNPYHRLRLNEIWNMPEVFSDPGFDNRKLLVNTGCMLVDFRRPWRGRVSFGIKTSIRRGVEDGKVRYRCLTMSEDWRFSRMVLGHGGKTAVTRRVRLKHYDHTGRGWPNYREVPSA